MVLSDKPLRLSAERPLSGDPSILQSNGSPEPDIAFRAPERRDASAMWRLAERTVDTNSPYSYLMLGEYFGGTCAVAERNNRVIGFATGLNPADEPETLFIWQIAVATEARGSGVASGLLDHLVSRPQVPRLRFLEATVTPSNTGSTSLFRSFARRWNTSCVEEELFAADDFPDVFDHEPEVRFRIGAF